MEEVLTLEESARVAKCAENTLRTAILRGDLKAVNIGQRKRRYWRITHGELLRWLGIPEATQPKAASIASGANPRTVPCL